jgi:cytochrome c550
MNRNAAFPFVIIMVVGVVVMFLISFKGIGDSKDLAAELNGSEEKPTETAAANPEDIYNKSCVGCHGNQYQGAVGPALVGVGDRLSKEEIQEIVVNGKNAMPSGLVPAEKAGEMAEWLSGL